MKNVVLNIIYKLRLELPSAVSGCGDEVDGCWCLASARRRMSGPSLPRCQLLATINTDHWPWDLEPSHQWSQEASWQQRWRLIRLLLSLDNKFTFILILPHPQTSHRHTNGNSQAKSRISEYLSVSVSRIRSRGHRTRIAGGDDTQTPGLVTTEEAPGDASGTGQSWSLSINPPAAPLSTSLFSNLEICIWTSASLRSEKLRFKSQTVRVIHHSHSVRRQTPKIVFSLNNKSSAVCLRAQLYARSAVSVSAAGKCFLWSH